MKTKLTSLSLAAAFAFGCAALADDSMRTTRLPQTSMPEGARTSWNEQPFLVRTIGYPFVLVGRTGNTLMHSPQIVSETFRGERPFLSKRGFFAQREESIALTGHKPR